MLRTKTIEDQLRKGRLEAKTFDGGAITSDAGALLLRQVEANTQIIQRFAKCFTDHRLAKNDRLRWEIDLEQALAEAESRATGQPARRFKDSGYAPVAPSLPLPPRYRSRFDLARKLRYSNHTCCVSARQTGIRIDKRCSDARPLQHERRTVQGAEYACRLADSDARAEKMSRFAPKGLCNSCTAETHEAILVADGGSLSL